MSKQKDTRKLIPGATLFGCFLTMLMLALSGTGCQGGGKSSTDADTIDTNAIRIGTLNQNISYYEKEDTIMGYEYEVANLLADSLHKKPVFVIGKDINQLVNMLEHDSIDLIAYPLNISNELKDKVIYTNHTYETRQVLVQRKTIIPKRKKRKKKQALQKGAELRDVTQLVGKEVWVLKDSKYEERLKNLNDEVGGGIVIKEAAVEDDEEDLMEKVSKGEIEYTVCDHIIAMASNTDFSNLDIETPVSFEQRAAWATKDTTLLKKINEWFDNQKNAKPLKLAYNKYFQNKHFKQQQEAMKVQGSKNKFTAPKIPEGTHTISLYDPYFKEEAAKIGWDWQWLAALARQESKFNPNAVAWSGARGLMQLMPATAYKLGAKSKAELLDPEINVRLAAKYLKKMSNSFSQVKDQNERIKFTLASYNAGVGHIKDAQALAKKHGKDPNVWAGNVEEFVRLKSNATYYNDPVVKHGYLHGNGVCNFVDEISAYYLKYKAKVQSEEGKSGGTGEK